MPPPAGVNSHICPVWLVWLYDIMLLWKLSSLKSFTRTVIFYYRHSRKQIVLEIQRPHGSKVVPGGSLSSHSSSENNSDKENNAPWRQLPCHQKLRCDGALPWQQNMADLSWQRDQERSRVCISPEDMRICRKDNDMEQRTSSAPSSEQVSTNNSAPSSEQVSTNNSAPSSVKVSTDTSQQCAI